MILIDAIYINYGGGLGLLKYLINSLEKDDVEFFLLQDARIPNEFGHICNRKIIKPSLRERYKFYRNLSPEITSVFCFSNVPPPMRLNMPVYTYFHNINLLKIPYTYTFISKIKCMLKRGYIRMLAKNTDKWIVQTTNTYNEIKKSFKLKETDIEVLPFYYIPKETIQDKEITERTDYVFVGDLSNAKGHDVLLKAWELLYKKGIAPTLHLTVDIRHKDFIKEIEILTEKGVKIVNHGCIPFDDVVNLYKKSKALIYPSLNESLGLGVIEAVEFGCDVIASDLPFTYSICEPSLVFDPTDSISIAKAIQKYETTSLKKSVLTINNKIKELLSLLK